MGENKDHVATVATPIGRVEAIEPHSVADLPSFYFNSADVGISLSDVCIIVSLDGVRKSRLHMSYTMAKTLMQGLQQAITHFERVADHTIMTMDETDAAFASLQPKQTQQTEE